MNDASRSALSATDAAAMIIGVVVGTGIFVAPAAVATACSTPMAVMLVWVFGGLVALAGVLCYAEMATSFPDRGGDYHYIHLALGPGTAFMFGWARMTIIQSGTIASLAYAFADYASRLMPLGLNGSAWLAVAAVLGLTAVHAFGLREGARTQNILTAVKLAGVALIIASGFSGGGSDPEVSAATSATPATWGLALVFVMYTYGGWNEAAYLAGEMKHLRRDFLRAAAGGVALIILLYVAVNAAYVAQLGLDGMRRSNVVAADFMRSVWGDAGGVFVSVLVACSALGATSAAIFTGARTNFALGRDHRTFRFMGRWHNRNHTPLRGLLVQAAISLGLIGLGVVTRQGFTTMVEFTAPGFWLFLFLSGVSLFILRRRAPEVADAFRVPGYPWTPVLFCLASGYMVYASVDYAMTLEGLGARAGIAVLLAGAPFLLWERLASRTGDGNCKD